MLSCCWSCRCGLTGSKEKDWEGSDFVERIGDSISFRLVTPDHCGSPFAEDVELMRMEIFHLECQGRTVVLCDRIPAFRFGTVHIFLLVVHDAELLLDVLHLPARGDVAIVQNLVEERQQMVANSTQDLLKVSRNGSKVTYQAFWGY